MLLPGKLEYVPSSEGLANWGTVVGGDTAFLTSYVDVPGAAGQSARQRLTAAARQASRQGRVLSQRRLKQGRLEGLEVVVEDDEERVTAYRWYLGGRRLFQLLAITPRERYRADSRLFADFFQSFRTSEEP